jgi:hypothetical protein
LVLYIIPIRPMNSFIYFKMGLLLIDLGRIVKAWL